MLARLGLALVGLSSLLSSGCASMYGTHPQDMTVPEHQEAARNDAAAAARAYLAAEAGGRGSGSARVQAGELQGRSAEHAAAAEARLQQVTSACAVESGPGLARLEVRSVERVTVYRPTGKGSAPERLVGVRIVGQARTGESLGAAASALRCEAERGAAGLARDPASPLSVPSATATVEEAPPRVVVEVRSADPGAAQEILRRATGLVAWR
jgi:hypothetical protein